MGNVASGSWGYSDSVQAEGSGSVGCGHQQRASGRGGERARPRGNPNSNKVLKVYADGSCLNNGQGKPKSGVGVYVPGKPSLNVSQPATGRATSTNAEIEAARAAIQTAKGRGYSGVRIRTDSDLVANCPERMPGWKANSWKTAGSQPMTNKVLLQKLDRISRGFNVQYEKVSGHSNNVGNEMADKLARKGARR